MEKAPIRMKPGPLGACRNSGGTQVNGPIGRAALPPPSGASAALHPADLAHGLDEARGISLDELRELRLVEIGGR